MKKRYILLFGILSLILTLLIIFYIFVIAEPYKNTEIAVEIVILLINVALILGSTLFRILATAIKKDHISIPIVIIAGWLYYVWQLYDLNFSPYELKFTFYTIIPIVLLDVIQIFMVLYKKWKN